MIDQSKRPSKPESIIHNSLSVPGIGCVARWFPVRRAGRRNFEACKLREAGMRILFFYLVTASFIFVARC